MKPSLLSKQTKHFGSQKYLIIYLLDSALNAFSLPVKSATDVLFFNEKEAQWFSGWDQYQTGFVYSESSLNQYRCTK